MKLKISNNPLLKVRSTPTAAYSTVSDNFKSKADGILIEKCPNVNAKSIIDSVVAYQTAAGNQKKLKNVRFQLPSSTVEGETAYGYTGIFDELTGYSEIGGTALSGFNSNGEVQSKPAIVGTWCISDYVDSTMLQTLTGDGDAESEGGMYGTDEPVISSDYRLDWSEMAVQTLDSSKPNYNPALAIILNERGYGHIYENTQHFPGKWWMTNDEAGDIVNIGTWFSSITGVDDTYGIVTNASSDDYKLTDLDPLSGFTSVKSLEMSAFGNNPDLSSARFPSSVTKIPTNLFCGTSGLVSVGNLGDSAVSSIETSAFIGCDRLNISDLGNKVTEIEASAFEGCGSLTFTALPSSLSYVNCSAFKDCSSISITEIPSSVGFIGYDAFNGCSGIQSLTINRGNSVVHTLSGAFDGGTYGIYVGGDNSGYLSNRTATLYACDSSLSSFSARINSAYRKHYAAKLAEVDTSGEYELQDFITSDGKSLINTGIIFSSGTRLEADISFTVMPSGGNVAVHGSQEMGLVGSKTDGLSAKLLGGLRVIESASEFTDGAVRNYDLDIPNSTAKINEKVVYTNSGTTEAANDGITFFGGAYGKFVGTSWSDRITVNGETAHDYVPVRRKSDSVVGLYDITTKTFFPGDCYTSNGVGFKAYCNSTDGIATEDGDLVELC